MKTKTFYGFALTSPLWLPILLRPLANVDLFEGLIGFLTLSLIYGGIPYLLFLGGAFFYFRRQSGQRLRDATKIFPVIFTGILLLGLVILGLASSQLEWALYIAFYFLTFGFVFGYAYVALAEIIYGLLGRAGLISDFAANDSQPIRLELQ